MSENTYEVTLVQKQYTTVTIKAETEQLARELAVEHAGSGLADWEEDFDIDIFEVEPVKPEPIHWYGYPQVDVVRNLDGTYRISLDWSALGDMVTVYADGSESYDDGEGSAVLNGYLAEHLTPANQDRHWGASEILAENFVLIEKTDEEKR